MRKMRKLSNSRLEGNGFSIHELTMNKKVSPRHTKNYHKKKSIIKRIILSKTQDHEIIHGETAVHKHTPFYLHRHTGDIDIFSRTPKKDAVEVEKALDKAFGGDYFYVQEGKHIGTQRVISRNSGESVADYTKPDKKIPHQKIDGHNYVTPGYIKRQSMKVLDDPFSGFRHGKDYDTYNRIVISEKEKKK